MSECTAMSVRRPLPSCPIMLLFGHLSVRKSVRSANAFLHFLPESIPLHPPSVRPSPDSNPFTSALSNCPLSGISERGLLTATTDIDGWSVRRPLHSSKLVFSSFPWKRHCERQPASQVERQPPCFQCKNAKYFDTETVPKVCRKIQEHSFSSPGFKQSKDGSLIACPP